MTNPEKENNDPKDDEGILKLAKARFQLAVESESENRTLQLEDLRFMVGDQWPTDIRRSREEDSRPCLTINRLPQYVRQITNDQRQNRPSIKINPVDDKADEETAKVNQGMIRHVEVNSHADIAYDTAFEWAAEVGKGYWRIVTDYADDMSFQQEILIKQIKDSFSVYVDPFYQEPDGSDMNFAFIFEDMSRDEYEAQYPDSDLSSMTDWETLGSISPTWVKKDGVRVAEYYYKVFEKVDICLLLDDQGKQHVLEKKFVTDEILKTMRVVSERTTVQAKIKWCKINGVEILEATDIPGKYIPVIPVHGDEHIVEGKRIFAGIIRDAKDAQKMYNFWASAETETIALAPKAPFIGAEGQFEGHENEWHTANSKNHAFLEYKQKDLDGNPVQGPPQRQVYEAPVQAITQARAQSIDDLKATTGIYDATLGNRSNETSGVAIQRRNAQAQVSNFHYIDNFNRSLRHAGRILLSWIPEIYDTEQMVRIIGDSGEVEFVLVNQSYTENGETKAHHLNVGRYDVTVDTGPSYQTKRQEAVASMLDLLRSAPQLMQVSGDLLVKNMDWPGSQEIAERIKKTIPPNIVSDDGQQQIPPQAQAQIQQMQAMIKGLTQELNHNTQIIETKSLELASKERIAAMEADVQLRLELLKHNAKDGQLAFLEETKLIHKRLDMLGFQQPVDPSMQPQAQAQPQDPNQAQDPTGGLSPGSPTGGATPGQNMGGQP